MVEPVLVGRNEAKLRDIADRHGLPAWTTDLDAALGDDPDADVYFDAQVTGARETRADREAIDAGQAHLHREADRRATSTGRSRWPGARGDAGVKHGVVHDKLYLPGLVKLRRLVDGGFFGRILSVRGEFGYWVFEGDWQAAQRPSWNYRAEDGGGIVVDMFCHWNYVLESILGPVRAVTATAVTHIPERVGRAGSLRRHRRRRRVRDLRAGRRGHRADQLVVVRAGPPRRAGRVPGRRHPRQRRRRAARVPRPAPRGHAEAGVEPGPAGHRAFRAQWQRGPGQRRRSTTASRPSGSSSSATSRGRAAPVRPAAGARGVQLAELGLRSSAEGRRLEVPGARAVSRSCADAPAPRPAPARDGSVEPCDAPGGRRVDAPAGPIRSRIAYAAAHVVADPLGGHRARRARPRSTGTPPWRSATTSGPTGSAWPTRWTPRSAAWAWTGPRPGADPPQRGRGARVRRARSSCGRRHRPRSRDAAGSSTPSSAAYGEQLALVVDAGAGVVLMASRAARRARHRPGRLRRGLRAACSPRCPTRSCCTGSGRCSTRRWPATGARPTSSPAADALLALIADHAAKVDGVKVSLLDRRHELALRATLPPGVRALHRRRLQLPGADQGRRRRPLRRAARDLRRDRAGGVGGAAGAGARRPGGVRRASSSRRWRSSRHIFARADLPLQDRASSSWPGSPGTSRASRWSAGWQTARSLAASRRRAAARRHRRASCPTPSWRRRGWRPCWRSRGWRHERHRRPLGPARDDRHAGGRRPADRAPVAEPVDGPALEPPRGWSTAACAPGCGRSASGASRSPRRASAGGQAGRGRGPARVVALPRRLPHGHRPRERPRRQPARRR